VFLFLLLLLLPRFNPLKRYQAFSPLFFFTYTLKERVAADSGKERTQLLPLPNRLVAAAAAATTSPAATLVEEKKRERERERAHAAQTDAQQFCATIGERRKEEGG
jgi:hypothetical protein